MYREWLIELYLLFYRVLFFVFKFFPVKNKIVEVTSFRGNNINIYKELNQKQFQGEIVFLCSSQCYGNIKKSVNVPVYLIEAGKLWDEIKAAYHLSTAKTIIVDNYYGFLAVANFKDDVECIQVWHAVGAIKKFGLQSYSVSERTLKAKKRFINVYSKFNKVVVNSNKFANIFKEAFLIEDHQFLPFGFPRADFFYNKDLQKKREERFYSKYPIYKNKKIILYAPTFRPDLDENQLALDLELLYKEFHEDFVLFVRLHQAVNNLGIEVQQYGDFVVDFSKKNSVNELLVVSDYLITDYSSIPFEYVLLKKPMIFFPYDLESYKDNPGLWGKYEDMVPGPIAHTTTEIINHINSNNFDWKKYTKFEKEWNEFSDGSSTKKLVQYILERHLNIS